jgi:hypothetical protein
MVGMMFQPEKKPEHCKCSCYVDDKGVHWPSKLAALEDEYQGRCARLSLEPLRITDPMHVGYDRIIEAMNACLKVTEEAKAQLNALRDASRYASYRY